MLDPFSETASWTERIRVSLREQRDAENKKATKIVGATLAVLVPAVILGFAAWGDGGGALMMVLSLAVLIAVGVKACKTWVVLNKLLNKHFGE
jgi:hypothetical protein